MKIVADINIPYIEGVLEPYAEVVYLRGAAISAADVRDADALLVRTRTRCDAALLGRSRVKIVATATIGTDHIDMLWCAANGIEVVSAAGSNAAAVLQWMSAALTLLAGRGRWTPRDVTLGVVGVGNVGSLISRYARLWGFRVLCSDPPRERTERLGRREGFMPLTELASRSDIITFHTPLTREGEFATRHLADEPFFAAIRDGAAVINSSRGGVIEQTALKNGVARRGVLSCLDTWEGEPDIDRNLLAESLIATPHIAGYSAQGKANASAAIIRALGVKFALPFSEWYPEEVATVGRRQISWDEMTATISSYCDLNAETRRLKRHPADFELLREGYEYRQEYF